MALIQLNFASRVLAMPADVTVLLPERDEQFSGEPLRPYRVLYLLHGLGDDRLGWLRYTTVENAVRGTDVAVVMPSVGHGFYTNMAHGHPYLDFVADELPRYLCSALPLSRRRKDTFVMGNSMGGYGAFKLALTYPERYARAMALSGVLDVRRFVETFRLEGFDPAWAFGEGLEVAGGEDDLLWLLERDVREGRELPELAAFCGRDDILLEESRTFEAAARRLGVPLRYEEGAGEHLWTTWARHVDDAVAWLTR